MRVTHLADRKVGRSAIVAVVWIQATCSVAVAQCANIQDEATVNWVNSLIGFAIGDDDACRSGAPDRDSLATTAACNIFVGRVMARMYGLTSFRNGDDFYRANDIAGLLPTLPEWRDLGTADDQSTLQVAADAANRGHVVLAVWGNPNGAGHVAMIGPGPLTFSGTWGLRTPVAASFKVDHPEDAFLGQPLACAFGPTKKASTHLYENTSASPQ